MMKKCAVVLMSLLILVGITFAGMTEQEMQVRAQKAVQSLRPDSPLMKMDQSRLETANKPHSPKQLRDRNLWKENVALHRFSGMSMQKSTTDFSIQINGADTTTYFVGDSITLTVTTNRPLGLMMFVDDGDNVFSFSDLNAFAHLEMGGEEFVFMIEDGDEMDMTPPGDGIWEVKVPTDFADDGPLMTLQNTTFYVVAMDMDTELYDLAVAYVEEPLGATSYVWGNVSDGTSPVQNILMVAFPGTMDDTLYAKSEGEPGVVYMTLTDQNGNYALYIPKEVEGMYSGPWTVFALNIWQVPGGMYADPMYQTVFIPGTPSADFTLTEGAYTISGVVTSTMGLPVSNVRLLAWNGMYEVMATTDGTGYYEIPVMSGWWEIEFFEEDLAGQYLIPYWGQYYADVMDANVTLNIQLYNVYPEDAISGTVSFNVPTKYALTDLSVIADKWLMGYSIAPVDEFGNYAVPVTSELDCVYVDDWGGMSYGYGVWVSRNDYEDPVTVPDYYSEVMSGATGIDFLIVEPDAALFGVVTDFDSGNPLYDAEVNVYTPDYAYDYWTYTDKFGNYSFDLIGGMTYIIEAYYPYEWYMPAHVDSLFIPEGGMVEYHMVLKSPQESVHFQGNVYDEYRNPVGGAVVDIESYEYYSSTVTDGGGYFYFDGLKPYDSYYITVNAAGFDTWYENVWVEGPIENYEIYLSSHSDTDYVWVQGQVTDGVNPVSEAIVWHYDEYGDHHQWTGEDGYFDLWVPQGELQLKIGANGFNAVKPVFLLNQDTTIVVPLSPATLTENVSAQVTDPEGTGIQDAFIYWESQDYIGHTYSGENGNYSIDLMTGEYYVHAEHWDFHDRNYVWSVPDPENDYHITMISLYEVYGPQIVTVEDVPEDHGGKVILSWRINESLVWQGIQGFVVLFSEQDPASPDFKGWLNFPGNVFMALPEMDTYHAVVPVLHNDVATHFVVVAVNDWDAWPSHPAMGMAHDNLPPAVPTGLGVAELDGNVQIWWAPVEMEPIQYYTVYRSVNGGAMELLDHTIDLEYTDSDMIPGNTYLYAVSATDYSANESEKSEQVSFHVTSVEGNQIPEDFALRQNYPNPFNPVTTLSFDLPKAVNVSLVIYDILGNHVKTVYTGELEAGRYDFKWDATNARGRSVSSGMYIYKLTAGEFSAFEKMILLR
ncbi:MAG: carboxypeptidase regulatory-like domain-containing protein [Fidelibacterota bacterium]